MPSTPALIDAARGRASNASSLPWLGATLMAGRPAAVLEAKRSSRSPDASVFCFRGSGEKDHERVGRIRSALGA
ncbi:MAG: hypothetical protein Q8M07_09605 [Prosthecobacter sp.]|nr:hypothetical protein [Prosthecobacter sp.]